MSFFSVTAFLRLNHAIFRAGLVLQIVVKFFAQNISWNICKKIMMFLSA